MATTTAQKLQHELNSLLGLSIINIVCSALALAFGAYFLMPNLISLATTLTIELNQIGLIILGGLAFAIAIRWLISSAEMIEVNSTLTSSLSEHKKNNTLNDEALTGLIVDMTAAYRENKPTLKLMVTISRIAGVCFGIAAVLALGGVIAGALTNAPLWANAAQISNVAINLAMAAACFIIPHFFGKYSTVWDQRLAQTAKAEVELQKALGEAQ
ncbi:MAG: hypothetical protein M1540_06125 [Candidatus Bathyarchaeota archaeon]|nr:hypothetical protein [Candidatus Bathyarchaeota archaeon]